MTTYLGFTAIQGNADLSHYLRDDGNVAIAGTLAVAGVVTAAVGLVVTSGGAAITGASSVAGLLTASADLRITTATTANLQFYNTNYHIRVTQATGVMDLITNNVIGLSIGNGGSSVTVPSRLIAGTDIATSTAYAVFGDGTGTQPTFGFTPVANILGIASSLVSTNSSGVFLHAHIQTKQTVASTSIQGLETWTWAAHTSGTLGSCFGLVGNTSVSGVGGTTTTVIGVTGGCIVSGGTVTTLKDVNGGSQVDGASSLVTNHYNFYGKALSLTNSGACTNNYGLFLENVTGGGTLNYAIKTNGGRVGLGSLPTSSAGLASGDVWNNSGVLNIV